MNVVEFKVAEAQPLATGRYKAVVKEVVASDGQYGPQIRFSFALQGHDRTLFAWCNAPSEGTITPKSKLFKWAATIVGEGHLREHGFKAADLEGKPVTLVVTEATRDGGEVYNKVTDLLPAAQDDLGL